MKYKKYLFISQKFIKFYEHIICVSVFQRVQWSQIQAIMYTIQQLARRES